LYGAARIGDVIVTSNFGPASSGWAIVLLSVALLALGGCGRKGALDLPPSATSPAAAAAADSDAEAASKPSLFNPNYGADAPPTAPKGAKRPFILDPLLGPDHSER
jgi:predicted small lipoprotein YifL